MDLLDLDSLFTRGGAGRARARSARFADEELRPHVDGWFARGEFPRHLPRAFGELGILGMHLEGYGCAGKSAVEYGLACMEIEAVRQRPAHVRLRPGLARDDGDPRVGLGGAEARVAAAHGVG